MAANVYLITNDGFFKNKFFDKTNRKFEYVFVKEIRNATALNKGAAESLKEEIGGFLWYPFKEEISRYVWIVEKTFSYDDKIQYYKSRKIKLTPESDINFLKNRNKIDKTIYYDSEMEADFVAIKKNEEIRKEYFKKITEIKEKSASLFQI